MKLQLKRSNVLELGGAKEPTAAQMEYGELAVNYNNGDPAIFLKDSNDNIIRIAGVGNINSGDTPSGDVLPPTGNQVGDVFFNTTNNTMYYWDGSQWVPIANDVTAAEIYVGTLAEINAEVPANERRNGFLWWNTEDGTLYIWYIDANTSQFVIAIPSSGGGGGASVAVNNVPPTNADQGDMWWNTTDGRLYIWYQDVDTGQWVDASPDSQVSPITSGDSFPTTGLENDMFFNTTDGRLYIYYNDGSSLQWVDASPDSQTTPYWDRNGATLSPSNDGDGMSVSGDVLFGKYNRMITNGRTQDQAPLLLQNTDNDGYNFVGKNANSVTTSFIATDGSAQFAGGKCVIYGEGSGQFYRETTDVDASLLSLRSDVNGTKTETCVFKANGSATFGSGNITIEADGKIRSVPTYNQSLGGNTRPMVVQEGGIFGYTSSTRASKTNIVALDNVDWIKDLNPVQFNYKKQNEDNSAYLLEHESVKSYGLIAEEVEDINSDFCYYDELKDGKKLVGVNYSALVAPTIKALQTALTRIEALEAEVQALKGGN